MSEPLSIRDRVAITGSSHTTDTNNVLLTQLEEGPLMISNLVDCAAPALHIGQAVEVAFDPLDEIITLPKFRPASLPGSAEEGLGGGR